MTSRLSRSPGTWTDPLAYAGTVAMPRRRAANDKRAGAAGAGLRIRTRAAALAVVGAVVLGSLAHVTLRLLAG